MVVSEMAPASPFRFWTHKGSDLTKESEIMLWTILVILLVLWLLGFIGHIGGNLIHLLLVVAVIVLIYNLVTGRRSI